MRRPQPRTLPWPRALAEGNAKQARKRVAAKVIIQDSSGRILLVDPTHKPDWDLPGGMAKANESPLQAARREVREELGLEVTHSDLLVVDWTSPHEPWDDTLVFIINGGVLKADEVSVLRPRDDELTAVRFCTYDEAAALLPPHDLRRIAVALAALSGGPVRYVEDGAPHNDSRRRHDFTAPDYPIEGSH